MLGDWFLCWVLAIALDKMRKEPGEKMSDRIPDHITAACEKGGYTEPFQNDGQWWAFPPNGIMSVPLHGQLLEERLLSLTLTERRRAAQEVFRATRADEYDRQQETRLAEMLRRISRTPTTSGHPSSFKSASVKWDANSAGQP